MASDLLLFQNSFCEQIFEWAANFGPYLEEFLEEVYSKIGQIMDQDLMLFLKILFCEQIFEWATNFGPYLVEFEQKLVTFFSFCTKSTNK